MLKSVFTTGQGETSRITDAQDGTIFAIHVDKITAPQVRPLAEVKDKATAAWQAEQRLSSANQQAAALAATVTPDGSLAKAAADRKLKVATASSLSRSAAPGQAAPAALVVKLFQAKSGDVVTGSDASGAYVAQLKEIQSPEAVPDADATKLSDQLASEAKVGVAGEFTGALRQRFPVEVQRDVIDRMF